MCSDQRHQQRDGDGHMEVQPDLQPAIQANVATDSTQHRLAATQQHDQLLQIGCFHAFGGARQPRADEVDDVLLVGVAQPARLRRERKNELSRLNNCE